MAIRRCSNLPVKLAAFLCLTAVCLLALVKYAGVTTNLVKEMKMVNFTDSQNKSQAHEVQLSKQIEQRQRERQQHVKNYCKRHTTNNTKKLNLSTIKFRPLFVNDKYRVISCLIPKVACSQWKRVFLTLENRTRIKNVHNPRYFKLLSGYSNEGIKLRLQSYFKFLFVREPFERLLSAYENKFVERRWSSNIIARFSKQINDNFKQVDPNSDDKVTFTKFVYYVSSVGFDRNCHWASYETLCHPCDIEYDFIGHFEDMADEAPYILRQTGMDRVATFPDFITHNTTGKLLHKYAPVPREKIVELANAFRKDFETFNYKFPGSPSDLLRDYLN